MIVGQDESVLAPYLLGAKTWIGPKGQRTLLPKSEGDGYMLLSFVSIEFWFGRLLTNDELAEINLERRASTATYTDKHAAMEILGTINKPVLMESPFVKYLFIEINNEGYWNSYHTGLEFEDVVDGRFASTVPKLWLGVHVWSQSGACLPAQACTQCSTNVKVLWWRSTATHERSTIMTEEGFLGPLLGPFLQRRFFAFLVSSPGLWPLVSRVDSEYPVGTGIMIPICDTFFDPP